MRFKTTPLGVLCVYVGGLVAGAAYDSFELFLAMLATFFVGSGSMTFNDYFDWEIDKINHPERPIPKGILKPKEMLYFSIILFLAGVIVSYFINILCLIIAIFSLGILVFYEKYSKNHGLLGNMTVAFTSSIAFTFGGAAVDNPLSSLILTAIAFFIMVSREIIMDIRDSEGDRLFRKTLPVKMGKKSALHIATIFLIIAAILSPVPYFTYILNEWYLAIIVPVDLIAIYAIISIYVNIENAGKAASLIRVALVIGIVAFILGAVL
jgi:geranylgeranylglycerol-phosphate geranylgeranyltransferase